MMRASLTCCTLILFCRLVAGAGTLHENDFEAVPTGKRPGRPWRVYGFSSLDRQLGVVVDTDNHFGSGATNKVLRIADKSSMEWVGMRWKGGLDKPLLSVSFRFIYESDDPDYGCFYFQAGRDGMRIKAGEIIQTVKFQNGSVWGKEIFTPGQVAQADIVVNNGAEAVEYEGRTLDPGRFHLWIDGKLVVAPRRLTAGDKVQPPATIEQIELRSPSNGTVTFLIDDLVVRDVAAVTGRP